MSYSPTYTWTLLGATLNASELAQNQFEMRDYLNSGIEASDLLSEGFWIYDLKRGEYNATSPRMSFITGEMQGLNTLALLPSDRQYITSLIKQSDPTQNVMYVSIPNAGREVFLESYGSIVIEATLHVKMYPSIGIPITAPPAYAYNKRITPQPVKIDTRFYIEVDGVVQVDSRTVAFNEDSFAYTASTQSVMVNQTTNQPGSEQIRKIIPIYWAVTGLAPGPHLIRIVADPRCEKGYVAAINLTIEVLATGGYSSWVGTDFA